MRALWNMSPAENKFALIEERLADAGSRIVEQYKRVRQAAAEADEVEFNAMMLVNMLLTFNFMLSYRTTPTIHDR